MQQGVEMSGKKGGARRRMIAGGRTFRLGSAPDDGFLDVKKQLENDVVVVACLKERETSV
jgi:hypothetical protein